MKKFEITQEQIKQLHHNAFHENNQLVIADLKNWFPEAFEKHLEIGKWYKGENTFINIVNLKSNRAYGFNIFKEWENECDGWYFNNLTLATSKEVNEALVQEAKKRGFIKDDLAIHPFLNSQNQYFYFANGFKLWFSDFSGQKTLIFKDGLWATIETITKEEAEKLLNKKIV